MPYTFAAAETHGRTNSRGAAIFSRCRSASRTSAATRSFTPREMTEWEFLSEVVELADCGILLDVNNIYVSSKNHNFDPYEYLNSVPHHRVGQMHIAGHTKFEKYILDTHDHPVLDPVWKLYAHAIKRVGRDRDAARMGRSHPELRRSPRGSAEGESVCRKTIRNRSGLAELASVAGRRSMTAESDQTDEKQHKAQNAGAHRAPLQCQFAGGVEEAAKADGLGHFSPAQLARRDANALDRRQPDERRCRPIHQA